MDERDVKAHEESAIKAANEGSSFKERYSGEVWNHVQKLYRIYNESFVDKALEVLEEMHNQGETEGVSFIDLNADMEWFFARYINNGRKEIVLYKGGYDKDYEIKILYAYFDRANTPLNATSGVKELEEFGTLENLVKEFLNDNFETTR